MTRKISTLKKMSVALAIMVTVNASAQTSETVSINPGYTNQTFYSLQNGTINSIDNTDWDLGFQVSGWQAAVIINSKNNVHLYKAQKNISQWSSMVANDTTGVLVATNDLFNEDTTLFNGAFNVTNNLADPFDLGWGEYDFVTHAVTGDSIYFLKLANGTVKKFKIEQLANATYDFRFADVDGSNEQFRQFVKLSYAGKNFGYYSVQNDLFIDREPNKYTYDLIFSQYLAVNPIVYKVAGVLSNDSVQAVKAYPVDVTYATDAGLVYSNFSNIIGYDWKSYDFNTNTWTIADSTVYFVIDKNNNKWKVVFTGFSGSSLGEFYFDKTALTTGVSEINNTVQQLGMFPNPATSVSNLIIDSKNAEPATVQVVDVNGKVVLQNQQQLQTGLNTITLDVNTISSGIYFVKVQTRSGIVTSRFVKN
jgi:hypothetical protein